MFRRIIQIDEAKCNGCGLCAQACHEGAIGMVDGKAKLLREDYCDGLGDCLPACPAGAITFVEKEAPAYNENAVRERRKKQEASETGCPGSKIRSIGRKGLTARAAPDIPSQLRQWPVQIKLAPANAPYFSGAHLLVAADCTAYAYGSFHQEFMRGKVTLIGCPKLDMVDYTEKLTHIVSQNDIKSLTVIRMEVPCCGGMESACISALKNSGKSIPWQVVTIAIDGRILDGSGW